MQNYFCLRANAATHIIVNTEVKLMADLLM